MPKVIRFYVHWVDAFNTIVGKITMYMIFAMLAILLLSIVGRMLNWSLIWTVETAQFTLAGYYLVGGAYSMILNSHVRMDLLYGSLSRRKKAITDTLTDSLLIFYLVVLLIGAVSSVEYALEYDQTSRSAWGPPMAPVKIIMSIGILLMLLQSISTFFKDIAAAFGRTIDGDPIHE